MVQAEAARSHATDRSGAWSTRSGRGRIAAIDIARAIAIIGMLIVNSGPKDLEGPASAVWIAAHGRASLLFVLLAGIGISLLSRRRSPREAWRTLLWRAVVLLPIGIALEQLDHGAQVILPMYAALFLIAPLVAHLSARWLAALAATVAVVGPLLVIAYQVAAGEEYDREGQLFDGPVWSALVDLVVAGPYPLVTWVAPFLLGIALGRTDLRRLDVQATLIALGAGFAALSVGTSWALTRALGPPRSDAGLDHLVVSAAHTQMPLWLIGSTAAAVAVLGVVLAVTSIAERWFLPLVRTGQLALTVYAAHLVVLHLVPDERPLHVGGAHISLGLVMSVGAIALATAWRAFAPYGPLEAVMRPPWTWFRRRSPRASRSPAQRPGSAPTG